VLPEQGELEPALPCIKKLPGQINKTIFRLRPGEQQDIPVHSNLTSEPFGKTDPGIPKSPFRSGGHTRNTFLALLGLTLAAGTLAAQTTDELLSKYLAAAGGAEKMKALSSLRRTGRFIGGGGFEAPLVTLNKRPNLTRTEFTTQGLTGVSAYDGKEGWKIEPWGGKKDPESMSEEELKSIMEDADFDGPLVDSKSKGITVESLGVEPVEGSDAFKLKVTLPSKDVTYYFLDAECYLPIKMEIHRFVRGEEHVYEYTLSDYKRVEGVYLPFYTEGNAQGSADKSKTVYTRIEANVPMAESLFTRPPNPADHH
jgi:hypothetical protein